MQLHAAPSNDRVWNFEVPYASDRQIQDTLTKYGSGVHNEIHQDESSSDESSVSEGWRARDILAPKPIRPINIQGLDTAINPSGNMEPVRGYVTHLDGNPPPFDISRMQEIGRTPVGDHILQFSDPSGNVDVGVMERPELHDSLGRTVFEEDEEILDASNRHMESAEPASATRWDLPEGPVERVRYDARVYMGAQREYCRFTLINDNAPESTSENPAGRTEEEEMAAASSLEEGSAVSTSDEMEEGESQADAVLIPAIGSDAGEPLSPAVVTRANTISSPLKTSLTLPQPHLKGDALFELEYDTDSPPELLKADSSDERDSLDDHSIHSEETVIVRTVDCLEALAQMRQEAPTPDRNPELRDAAMNDLMEWIQRQGDLQEGVRCSENHRALRPLCEGMEVKRLYLEDLVDYDMMAREERGNQSQPEACATGERRQAYLLAASLCQRGTNRSCESAG
ncbi:hypothetical protein B0H13DRAFT_1859875 [Mycena leptocephala]|nr:hypothetical protein B0H13DRAFT_1859875 [Mycena leptocephala]